MKCHLFVSNKDFGPSSFYWTVQIFDRWLWSRQLNVSVERRYATESPIRGIYHWMISSATGPRLNFWPEIWRIPSCFLSLRHRVQATGLGHSLFIQILYITSHNDSPLSCAEVGDLYRNGTISPSRAHVEHEYHARTAATESAFSMDLSSRIVSACKSINLALK